MHSYTLRLTTRRGTFWIQRNANISGESKDSLARAVWFAWLRQDIWAAFRTGRPALTIHQPTKSMYDLTTEELTTRIIYITAKCVRRYYSRIVPLSNDFRCNLLPHPRTRTSRSTSKLVQHWCTCWTHGRAASLPPLNPYASPALCQHHDQVLTSRHLLQYGSIHPRMQLRYKCTTSPALWWSSISLPWEVSTTTRHASRCCAKVRTQSAGSPCHGNRRICQVHLSAFRLSMLVGQASLDIAIPLRWRLAAALCADSQEKQAEILEILDKVLHISEFPSRSVLNDLTKAWSSEAWSWLPFCFTAISQFHRQA